MDIDSLLNPKPDNGPVRSQPTRSNPSTAQTHIPSSPRPSTGFTAISRRQSPETPKRRASSPLERPRGHPPRPLASTSVSVPNHHPAGGSSPGGAEGSFEKVQASLQAIVALLGSTALAEEWADSIESGIQSFWSPATRNEQAQKTIVHRLDNLQETLRQASSRFERVVGYSGSDLHSAGFFFFSGIVCPLEVLLDGIADPPESSWFRERLTEYVRMLSVRLADFKTPVNKVYVANRLQMQTVRSLNSINNMLHVEAGTHLAQMLSELREHVDGPRQSIVDYQKQAKVLLIVRESLKILTRIKGDFSHRWRGWSIDFVPHRYWYLYVPTTDVFKAFDQNRSSSQGHSDHSEVTSFLQESCSSEANKFVPKKRQSRDQDPSQSEASRQARSTGSGGHSGSNSLSHPVSSLSARLHRLYFD